MKAPKCMYCGRFIALQEFMDESAKLKYTPDSDHSVENTEFYHVECEG
jgi:hypothetical protein